MTYPELCPLCRCPIQLLADGNQGKTRGTIHDAMARHYEVVHPDHEETE